MGTTTWICASNKLSIYNRYVRVHAKEEDPYGVCLTGVIKILTWFSFGFFFSGPNNLFSLMHWVLCCFYWLFFKIISMNLLSVFVCLSMSTHFSHTHTHAHAHSHIQCEIVTHSRIKFAILLLLLHKNCLVNLLLFESKFID